MRPLSGLVDEADSPTMCLPLCPTRLASNHWCVYFYKVRDPTSWTFKILLEGKYLLLRCTFDIFPVFGGGIQSVLMKLDCAFRKTCLGSSVPIFPEVSLLFLDSSFIQIRYNYPAHLRNTLILSSPWRETVTSSLSSQFSLRQGEIESCNCRKILVTELFFSNYIPYFSYTDFPKWCTLHAIKVQNKVLSIRLV